MWDIKEQQFRSGHGSLIAHSCGVPTCSHARVYVYVRMPRRMCTYAVYVRMPRRIYVWCVCARSRLYMYMCMPQCVCVGGVCVCAHAQMYMYVWCVCAHARVYVHVCACVLVGVVKGEKVQDRLCQFKPSCTTLLHPAPVLLSPPFFLRQGYFLIDFLVLAGTWGDDCGRNCVPCITGNGFSD